MSKSIVSKTCAHCELPAVKVRNEGSYCRMHYRILQMRHDAQSSGKVIPDRDVLVNLALDLLAAGMECPLCQRETNWLKGEGIKTVVTLQHDHSGRFRLLCLSCNTRHQHYPNDSIYSLPKGHKHCTDCKNVMPFSEFYKHKSYTCGFRSECRKCSIKSAANYAAKRRSK